MAGGSETGAVEELNRSFEGLEEEEEREGEGEGEIGEILTEGGRRRVFSKVGPGGLDQSGIKGPVK
jgi:hypothetical protein